MSRLAENLAAVKARISAAAQSSGRRDQDIRLVAVSKTKPADAVREAWRAGQRDFGENYLQDALEKITELAELDIHWHFIGAIQSNKTRAIAEHFYWVHTLDREKIARRLNDQRPAHLPPLNVCIQINLDDEDSKAGLDSIDAAIDLGRAVSQMPRLRLRGLMFIPQPRATAKQRLASCQRARALFDQFQKALPQADTLSLGMSADLEQAIAAGSTMVRIGTDIFGARS